MTRTGFKTVAGACIALVATTTLAGAGPTAKRRARVASRYVVNHQADNGSIPTFSPIGGTADAVVALAAAARGGGTIDDAIGYLRRNADEIDTVGEKAKVVMALVAAERQPRSFAGRNLIAEIDQTQLNNGRYGAETPVLDHALAILGMRAAGERVGPAGRWLARAQCDDGGWQRDRPEQPSENRHCFTGNPGDAFTKSDTNTTGLAVQALEVTPRREELEADPFGFFRRIRDPEKRGWGYSWGYRLTDTNSTSLVLQAYFARNRHLPDGAGRALNALQHRLCGRGAGAFSFTWEAREGGGYRRTGRDVGATVAAIPALMREALPVSPPDGYQLPPKIEPC